MHMLRKRSSALCLSLAVVLGSWKGYVALFDPGAREPKQIFPTMVNTLPPEDQESLNTGMLVRNDRQLQQLLEDLLS